MTFISDDPSWWPFINGTRLASYFIVAATAGIVYDWALSFGQEVELIWRQHWSLMTVLYLSVRYFGIIYAVINMYRYVMFNTINWVAVAIEVFLCVIMITRLYAMYQKSRTVLIFLVAIFLALLVAAISMPAISMRGGSGEEFVLSGTYQCSIQTEGDGILRHSIAWILVIVWEVLTVCLAVRIAVKHFCELRRQSAGGFIGDCFTVLIKTHLVYFASYLSTSCFEIGFMSPALADLSSGTGIYGGFTEIFLLMHMCVLGPRLILSVRQYHAKLVTDSDAASTMTSIVFERMHVSTSIGVQQT
ncbi:uncharacterized protein EDB91DRAFT_1247007 [Suillus paluster]|uniref:uncharacterized protein n=1 Tax=Suillus paluster TaxID=48578 RepID=UPI001B8618A3|nr:uncharacterized protein EDB91DRAFT_1247007 [Suillus paluster]KAG1744126.1 hypothetical protein EDB91DRAFT_1247007 [Suillus paluster]